MKLAKAWREYPLWEFRRRLAQWYAARYNHGYHGVPGGWIRHRNGKPIAQGWADYYVKMHSRIWQEIEALK
jgi:hypothetical protein